MIKGTECIIQAYMSIYINNDKIEYKRILNMGIERIPLIVTTISNFI